MVLICAGSEAAKWSAIQEAAHFRIVLGKKRYQQSKGLKWQAHWSREGKKDQIGCLCHLSLIILPRKRPFIQRSVFYERNQEPTEAASEWVSQLYLLIQDSYFTDKCDMMVIKITRGWHLKEIQKKLLTQDNFILEKKPNKTTNIRRSEEAIQKSRDKYSLAPVTYIL